MKRFLKIGCIGIAVFVVVIMIVASIWESNAPATQSIAFLNTGNAMRSVTFERVKADGQLADTYAITNELKPDETVIERVTEGIYKIKVWDASETLVGSADFEVKLKNPEESDYQLYRFDLAMDKVFAVVNLNSMYEGNAFAEHMAKAVGTQRDYLKVEKLYDGRAPFLVPENFTSRTFVDLSDAIPSSVKYGQVVYGLFALPKTLREDQLQTTLLSQITKRTN